MILLPIVMKLMTTELSKHTLSLSCIVWLRLSKDSGTSPPNLYQQYFCFKNVGVFCILESAPTLKLSFTAALQ